MKLKNYLTSLFFLLAPSISFQQSTMGVFLQNQKMMSVDNKKCKAGYLENKFYASCNGSKVEDRQLLAKVTFSYVIAREIEELNSRALTKQISDLENLIDRSILYETGKMVYRTKDSFDKFWWTGTLNATTQMYVDPKFYARTFIGNTGRQAIMHQRNAVELIRASEQHSILSYGQYKKIHQELLISYPIIGPLTEFAVAVNKTGNQAFKINEDDLEEYKKIRFKTTDPSSPEIRAISDRIINRIRNSPEFRRYEVEKDNRLRRWSNL